MNVYIASLKDHRGNLRDDIADLLFDDKHLLILGENRWYAKQRYIQNLKKVSCQLILCLVGDQVPEWVFILGELLSQ